MKLMTFLTWFNVYGSVKQAIQDVIGPKIQDLRGDIRAIDARIDGLEKRFDQRFADIDKQFDQMERVRIRSTGGWSGRKLFFDQQISDGMLP